MYGEVPPLAVTVAVPLLYDGHVASVLVADADIAVGSETVIVVVAEHPLTSVTVYVYVPTVTVKVPVPVYVPVPPLALTVTVAVPPLHAIAVADEEATNAHGAEHPATGWKPSFVTPPTSVPVVRYGI